MLSDFRASSLIKPQDQGVGSFKPWEPRSGSAGVRGRRGPGGCPGRLPLSRRGWYRSGRPHRQLCGPPGAAPRPVPSRSPPPSHSRRHGGGAASSGCSLVAAALADEPVAPGAPGVPLATRGTGISPHTVTRPEGPRPHSTAGAVRGVPIGGLGCGGVARPRGGGGAARSWRGWPARRGVRTLPLAAGTRPQPGSEAGSDRRAAPRPMGADGAA